MFLLLKNEQTFKVCFDLILFGRFALCILSNTDGETVLWLVVWGILCGIFYAWDIEKIPTHLI